jgi:ubiquinone/menaquinone biosynthesis C-methylase UbiE
MVTQTNIVREGYNKIAEQYYNNRDLTKFNGELENFSKLISLSGHILDVGCGAGIPTAKFLIKKGLKVTGIDISETMLNMAQQNVPEGNFINMDMRNLEFDDNSFDGIISVYTLFHVPKNQHPQIFKDFYRVLKSGGIMLINTGISESEGISNFFGVPMFWSNYDPKKTLQSVKDAQFEIIFEGVLIRGGEFQYWIMAKK